MADSEDTVTENLVLNDSQMLADLPALTSAISGVTDKLDALLQALGVLNGNLATVADNTQKVKQAEGDAEEQTNAFAGAMTQAGTAMAMAFGLGTYQIVNSVINLIKGGVQDGIDFAQAMFLINSAVSQMRDAGVDVQFQDLSNIVTTLGPKLQAFSNLDLSKIVGQVAGLGGQFGMTAKQVSDLTEFSLVAVERFGGDAISVATAVTSGMENLTTQMSRRIYQMTGVQITSQEVYNEAVALGLDNGAKTYQQLDSQTKQQAYLVLLQQQLAGLQKDEVTYADNAAGKVKDLGAAWQNLWTGFGLAVTNIIPELTQGLDNMIYTLTQAVGLLQAIGDLKDSRKLSAQTGFTGGMTWDQFNQDIQNRAAEVYKLYTNPSPSQVTGAPASPSTTPLGDTSADAASSAAEKAAADQLKVEADAEKEIVSLHDSEAAALEKIQTDYQNKLLDDQAEYDRAMVAEDVNAANQKQKIQDDAAEAMLVDAEKNRQSNVEAEQKYEEEMQTLTDSFQANLIDALRDNDAKTIIHLIEEYDNQKAEKTKQYNDDNVIRQEQYNQEINLAKQQEAYNLQQLNDEVAQRKAALKVQFDNENADAKTQRDRQNVAEQVDIDNRLTAWADGLQVQYDLTDAQMKNIYTVINDYLGKNGYVDSVYTYIIARMAQVYAALGAGTPTPTSTGSASTHRYASGGSLFASTPTNVTFGEAGPELAMFIPLGSGVASVPSPSVSGGGNTGGSIQLQVTLDPNLEAKIVQTSLDGVALSIERMQRQT
jgi:hypothetical protein